MHGTSTGTKATAPLLDREAIGCSIGVTRIARITHLDRSGIEVASAIRPGGHVLQVTNGKGLVFEAAADGAILEAAELWCAERVDATELHWASPRALTERDIAHLPPCALRAAPGVAPGEVLSGAEAQADARIAWRAGRELLTGQPYLVPAAAVHVPSALGPLLGCADVRWTSNGMGAHPQWPAALLHALLEALERDGLARTLPEGWTEALIAERHLPRPTLAPRVAELAAALDQRRFDVHLFDLRPAPHSPPLAGALLFDRDEGPIPLTAGYACRLDLGDALESALLEAAQSRLTDIHGAREDVTEADSLEAHAGAARLHESCLAALRAEARRRTRWQRPRPPSTPSRCVRAISAYLQRAGYEHVIALDLAPAELGLHVAKVVIPGLSLSELL